MNGAHRHLDYHRERHADLVRDVQRRDVFRFSAPCDAERRSFLRSLGSCASTGARRFRRRLPSSCRERVTGTQFPVVCESELEGNLPGEPADVVEAEEPQLLALPARARGRSERQAADARRLRARLNAGRAHADLTMLAQLGQALARASSNLRGADESYDSGSTPSKSPGLAAALAFPPAHLSRVQDEPAVAARDEPSVDSSGAFGTIAGERARTQCGPVSYGSPLGSGGRAGLAPESSSFLTRPSQPFGIPIRRAIW